MCQTRFLSSTTDETVFIGTTQPRPLVQVNEFGIWRYKFESTCQFLPTFIFILKSNHCGLRICVYPKSGGLQDETDKILAGRSTAVFGLPRLLNGRFPNRRFGRGPVLHKVATKVSRLTPCGFFSESWQGSRPFQPKCNLESGLLLKQSKDYGIKIVFCIYYINYTIEDCNSDRL